MIATNCTKGDLATIEALKSEARELLEGNILSFWLSKMVDHEHGGFYGRMDGNGCLDANAEKGCVLNARILWSFAAAYRVLGRQEYLEAALRAKDYILQHFIDREHGGAYWSLDCQGQPKDMKKQSYAIGFVIYGMSELYRAAADREALDCAVSLFRKLEEHAYDRGNKGYIEALTRDWRPMEDMRLSEKDENGSRTMNTHLHILEPYTNLYRVWKDPLLEQQLRGLIDIFTQHLFNPRTGHLDHFFNDQWQGRRDFKSYGHDIEAVWLLVEALEVLGDRQLEEQTMPIVNRIAKAAEEGLQADGAMIYERNLTTGHVDADCHWWVQCETVVGFLCQYQHSGDRGALERALRCFQYIDRHLVDREQGEWYWSIHPDGSINRSDDKAGFWKCPYHNSRMCLEILEREFS